MSDLASTCHNTQSSIEQSLVELQDILNGMKALPEQVDTIWYGFVEQFNEWFKRKLKTCLDKELELHEMYSCCCDNA